MCNLHFGRLTGTTIQNQEKGHAKGLRLFFNKYKGKQKHLADLRILCHSWEKHAKDNIKYRSGLVLFF